MKSISGLGLGLSLVFGCLLLALIAELYYLLWWKKRIITKIDENGGQIPPQTSHFFFIFCCWGAKPPSPVQNLCSSPNLVHDPQSSSSSNPNKDFFKQEINNLSNFPRFLFSITEETGEDLESEDGGFKNRKVSTSRSNLSDLIQILETPFLTPNASPIYFTPPLTPSFCDHSYHFSPFLETEKDAEFNRLRCSPPPKFKFLRDAEEKQRRNNGNEDEGNDNIGQFITLNIVAENQEYGDGVCKNFCFGENDVEKECFSSSSSKEIEKDNIAAMMHGFFLKYHNAVSDLHPHPKRGAILEFAYPDAT